MFKIAVLALFVVSASCVDVLEVSGNKLSQTSPVRVVNGISSVNGIRQVLPVGQSVVSGVSPVVSTYGNYGSYGIGGLSGLNTNLAYLRDLRARLFGSSINIAPSPLSQSLYAFRQPTIQSAYLHQPAPIAITQPGYAVAQPALASLAVHQPAVSQFAVAQPAISVARPQVFAAGQTVHPVNAAIQQVARTVEYRPIPYQDQPIVPQEVVVEPSDQPINIHFKSRSSTVRISSEHIPGEPGEVVQTNSQDEPSRVQHEVVKPVVQEVKEVIQPYRQVTQEIQPVVENVHTVVTHGEGQRAQYVAEPIRQQVLAVRPAVQQLGVQQLGVQQLAIRPAVQQFAVQPAYQQFAVQQPQYVAVSQPAIQSYGVQHVVPQVQTLSVAQPYLSGLSSYVSQPALALNAFRSVGIAQPVVGVNRVVSVQQPGAVIREEVRDVRPAVQVTGQGSNFVRYAESDD